MCVQKWLLTLALVTSCNAFANPECGLLLYPRVGTENVPNRAAKVGLSRLRSVFPAGLIEPRSAEFYRNLAHTPGPETIEALDAKFHAEGQIALPEIDRSFLTFYQVNYLASEQASNLNTARYSLLYLPKPSGLEADNFDLVVIEHPTVQTDTDGRMVYAQYNSQALVRLSPEQPMRTPVLKLERPQEARLAMYVAALAVPCMAFASREVKFTEPILRPLLVTQTCLGPLCRSKVSVLATYTYREDTSVRGSGEGELTKSFEYTITTRDGHFENLFERMGDPKAQLLDRRLVRALETLQGQL